ncbi:MAG TPA: hypothetical protein VK121_07285 [Pseudogracilibacillus sp.]|nr:hypothetical protein [Pseudogracilibacillus sp.]
MIFDTKIAIDFIPFAALSSNYHLTLNSDELILYIYTLNKESQTK